jgi:hypothetical protein
VDRLRAGATADFDSCLGPIDLELAKLMLAKRACVG